MCEQIADSHFQAHLLPYAGNEAHSEQGVASEGEEVIMPSDAFQLEYIGPDLCQADLDLARGGS
jgi:hypothetical protein